MPKIYNGGGIKMKEHRRTAMQYSKACGEEISKLAFGTMRLPLKEDGDIDQDQADRRGRICAGSVRKQLKR